MCKFNPKNDSRFIDPCMKHLIKVIDSFRDADVVACCCGHKKYPMTIVVKFKKTGWNFEIMSNQYINRKKKFYKKDKQGYYYIPETINNE